MALNLTSVTLHGSSYVRVLREANRMWGASVDRVHLEATVQATGDGVDDVALRGVKSVAPARHFVDEVLTWSVCKWRKIRLRHFPTLWAKAQLIFLPAALMSFLLFITSVMLLVIVSLNTWDATCATFFIRKPALSGGCPGWWPGQGGMAAIGSLRVFARSVTVFTHRPAPAGT